MKEELSDQGLQRAEREMRDADRVADAEQRSGHAAGGNGHDEAAGEHGLERARHALTMARNPTNKRSRHIGYRLQFVRDAVGCLQTRPHYVGT